MTDRTTHEERAAALRARFPRWRVWYVPRASDGGATWHAQPAGYPLNADSAAGLAEAIEAHEGG